MTIAPITSKYVVHANQIYKWKKETLAFMVSGFKSKSKQPDTSQDDLIKALFFEQIGQLTVERDKGYQLL